MVLTLEPALSHTPVMVAEAIAALAPRRGGRYVDCTVGGGGHAQAILEVAAAGGLLLGIDVDSKAIEVAGQRLAPFGEAVRLVQGNFRQLAQICRDYDFSPVEGVLFDLGVSSLQLGEAARGFSFQAEAPLDMRLGEGALTAAEIVNGYPEEKLADLLWRYGEERRSRRIARAIVRARPIRTTTELAAIVARAVGKRGARLHPATRTFQALRIAVNDELNALAQGLEQALELLAPGGRLVAISFQSLEDRIVKQFMQRESRDCLCPPAALSCRCGHQATLRLLDNKGLRPSPEEVAANPRSRSARLRAAEKL